MSYTPINWQTGDTITAEKLNRCDNGWSVGMTQLFSETVTTTDTEEGFASGQINYVFASELPETVVIIFDGTEYAVALNANYGYGEDGETAPDFTNYPFYIYPRSQRTDVFTSTAGTHTVILSSNTVVCGDKFTLAVQNVIEQTSALSFELVEDTTLYEEASAAFNNGRLLYFNRSLKRYFVTELGWGNSGVKFVPESNEFTAGFDYDDSTFYFTSL